MADPFAAGPDQTPSESSPRQRGATVSRGANIKSSVAPAQSVAPASSQELRAGTELAEGGLGQIATDPGGIAIGGGPSTGAGASPPGTRSQSGMGTALGPSGTSPGGGGSSPTKSSSSRSPAIPAIVIPEAIRGTTSPYEGEIYVDVDFYVLFGPDMRVGIPVPGNEVCLEGDQIRTIQAITFLDKTTNISKCEIWEYGEDRKDICAPGAHTTISSSYHLSSPVNYSVNFCLVYDRSNCDWRNEGDGREQQVCKAGSEYKGIWAAGTQFHYRCANSESQTYSHPLQYQIRFMRDVEYPERNVRRRLVLRQSRAVEPC